MGSMGTSQDSLTLTLFFASNQWLDKFDDSVAFSCSGEAVINHMVTNGQLSLQATSYLNQIVAVINKFDSVYAAQSNDRSATFSILKTQLVNIESSISTNVSSSYVKKNPAEYGVGSSL